MTRFPVHLLTAALLGLCVVICCPSVDADCGRVRSCAVATPYVAPVVASYSPVYPSVTVATVQAYPVVAVPLYSAGYSAGDATVQQLVQLLLSQQQRLDKLEQQGPTANTPRPGGMAPAAPEANRTWTSCVGCHDGNAAKGEGHVLFAGGLPTHWDAGTMIEVVDRTTRPADAKGSMPKGGPALTGEDVEAMLSDVKRMAATAQK